LLEKGAEDPLNRPCDKRSGIIGSQGGKGMFCKQYTEGSLTGLVASCVETAF